MASAVTRPMMAAGTTITGAACQPECATHTPTATGPANWPRLLACCSNPIAAGTADGFGAAWGTDA